MKRLFLIFLLLIIAVPCFGGQTLKRHLEPETVNYFSLPSSSGDQFTLNEQIKLIKYNGGSGTLSGLVANFSNATGFQFVTNPSVDLRKWIGYYITFTSSVGNTLKVKVSAAGTAETLGDELTGDATFDDGTKWTADAGWAVSGGKANATTVAINKLVYTKASVNTVGALYKMVSVCDSITSGTFAHRLTGETSGATYNSTGTKTDYITKLTFTARYFGINPVSTLTASFTDFSVKQVLTPSSTGIYFTDPVVTGTFDYNAASYTAVITRN